MEPLPFFSYGLTKSGSTLAFELARVALEQAGHPQDQLQVPGLVVSRRINAIEHLTSDQAAALRAEVSARGGPVVLKTHTRLDPSVAAMVIEGAAKAHVVLRDPRDVALSMLDNGRVNRAAGRPAFAEIETLADAANAIENQIAALTDWAALPGVPVLIYDQLAFDTEAAAAQIIAHLGLDADPARVADQVRTTSFTQFNKGKRDRHREEMSVADSAAFTLRFAAFYDAYLPHVDNPGATV